MPPTLVRGHLVDLAARRISPTEVEIADGRIAALRPIPDEPGLPTLVPGFVDAHVHVESSLLTPYAFARLAMRHGTVAVVCDPHEIANVCGVEGVEYMIADAARSPLHFAFGAPSCVPATTFETAGATLGIAETTALLARPEVRCLAELMNVPGAIHHEAGVMAKVAAARAAGKVIDGHGPGLTGEDAKAYAALGVSTDHECSTLAEAREKAALGMKVLIREGSAARNFDALLPLLAERPDAVMFCTDDRHPDGLLVGHIDGHVRRAIAAGYDPFAVLHAACVAPAEHYGLDLGRLRVGDRADFAVLDDLDGVNVRQTWIGGVRVWDSAEGDLPADGDGAPPVNRFVPRPVRPADLVIPALPSRRAGMEAMVAFDGELLTGRETVIPRVVADVVEPDPVRDLLLLVVVNRYAPAPPALALLRGFGLQRGALASSVAHDSHNVVAVGADRVSLARAITRVMEARGGLAFVDGAVEELLPLPVAGLMSPRPGDEVAAAYTRLDALAKAAGSRLRAPYMTLSFMALPVIPQLKLTDRGLFDVDRWAFV